MRNDNLAAVVNEAKKYQLNKNTNCVCTLCVKVMVRRIDNEGKTVWTALFGAGGNAGRSVGFAIAQVRVNHHFEAGNVVLKSARDYLSLSH